LIATGTGISPLWAILERRVKTGCYKNLLFFGTRHPEHDFYFREEIERMEKSGFCRSFIAFSQFGRKTYVQDLIPAQWELVNSFLLDGGFVYICGKAKTLVKSIKNNLKDCLHHQFSVKEAEEMLKRLENSKRLCSENW
jgi:sulfite reductase alpha subunit-like flavoprotein